MSEQNVVMENENLEQAPELPATEELAENEEIEHMSQDKFLNDLRIAKTAIQVSMANGKFINGRIISFDRFTVQMRNAQGTHLVFKSGIMAISPIPQRPTTTAATSSPNPRNKPQRQKSNNYQRVPAFKARYQSRYGDDD